MKKFPIVFIIVCLIAGAWDCRDTPTEVKTLVVLVLTDSATLVSSTGASLNATVNPGGLPTTCFFEYGTTKAYGTHTPTQDIGTENAPLNTYYMAGGLTPATEYHFRVTATNTNGAFSGIDMMFTTLALTPVVTTDSVVKLGQTSAILKGKVDPMGFATVFHFEYGTNTNYGTSTSTQGAGSGTTAISESTTVSNLITSSLYHWRVVATNNGGTVYGQDGSFTAGFPPPSLSVNAVIIPDSTQAILSGFVNPKGAVTTYHFEYGTSTGYGQNTAPQDAGSGVTAVQATASLTNLVPGTLYHWRLVASSIAGTVSTSDSTFTFTLPVDLAFPLRVGTTWTYRHTYEADYVGSVTLYNGIHIWQIVSSTTSSDSTIYSLTDTQTDTVRFFWETGSDTTTSLSSQVVPFTIVETQDAISINVREVGFIVHPVARYIQTRIDTINLSYYDEGTMDSYAIVRSVGLAQYEAFAGGNNYTEKHLDLLSVSI
jgi:hypothetical protein